MVSTPFTGLGVGSERGQVMDTQLEEKKDGNDIGRSNPMNSIPRRLRVTFYIIIFAMDFIDATFDLILSVDGSVNPSDGVCQTPSTDFENHNILRDCGIRITLPWLCSLGTLLRQFLLEFWGAFCGNLWINWRIWSRKIMLPCWVYRCCSRRFRCSFLSLSLD